MGVVSNVLDPTNITAVNQYIQKIMQTEPAPPTGSTERAVLQGLLNMLAAVQNLIAAGAGGASPWQIQFEKELRQIVSQARLVDEKWHQQSRRPLIDIPSDVGGGHGCGLLSPWGCFTDALGPVLGWVLFGTVAYYGGRWVYRYIEKKTRIPESRLPRYAGGRRPSRLPLNRRRS